MSQANVEILRAAYKNREPDLNFLHPDVEWHTRADLPDSATYRGHDGVTKLASEWFESFDDFQLELEELIDARDDVVIALVRLRGRIRGSGEEVDMLEAHVWTMLEGRGIECREYPTKVEALEALRRAE